MPSNDCNYFLYTLYTFNKAEKINSNSYLFVHTKCTAVSKTNLICFSGRPPPLGYVVCIATTLWTRGLGESNKDVMFGRGNYAWSFLSSVKPPLTLGCPKGSPAAKTHAVYLTFIFYLLTYAGYVIMTHAPLLLLFPSFLSGLDHILSV